MEQHSDHPKHEYTIATTRVVEAALARQDIRDALFLLRRAQQRFSRYPLGSLPGVSSAAYAALGYAVSHTANTAEVLEVLA